MWNLTIENSSGSLAYDDVDLEERRFKTRVRQAKERALVAKTKDGGFIRALVMRTAISDPLFVEFTETGFVLEGNGGTIENGGTDGEYFRRRTNGERWQLEQALSDS